MQKLDETDSNTQGAIRRKNEDWHDKEAKLYDDVRSELWNLYEQRRLSSDLREIDTLCGGQKAIDIGCGTGNLALKFSNMGYEVEAVDISQEMLDVLASKVDGEHNDRISLHNAPADHYLEEAESVDIVCFSSVLHHLPDYFQTLEKAAKTLKPGGVIYVAHEPLPSKKEKQVNGLRWLDSLLTPRSSVKELLGPDKDCPVVDYHIDSEDGVKLEELIDHLKEAELTIKELEKYSCWQSSMLSALNQLTEIEEPTDFKLIARKSCS